MENNKIKDKIDELVESLNRASKAYYNGADEIMPNYEWDALFDELTQLEKETGYIRQDSPTQNAGYEAEAGNRRMLRNHAETEGLLYLCVSSRQRSVS